MNSIYCWSKLFIGLRKTPLMRYTEIKQLVLLTVLPLFIINLYGFISTRVISKSEIIDFNTGKYYYLVYSRGQAFQLERSASISDGIFPEEFFRYLQKIVLTPEISVTYILHQIQLSELKKGNFLVSRLMRLQRQKLESSLEQVKRK